MKAIDPLCVAMAAVMAGSMMCASPGAGQELRGNLSRTVTASSAETEVFAATNACDGRMDTRWSSAWSDDQWLQIDLGHTTTVCGLTMEWESAFGSAYRVLVSQNGSEWIAAYATQTGDGQTDEIFFKPVTGRYVKVAFERRATSWGYSLWDLSLKGPDEQLVVDAPTPERADDLCDGDTNTVWTSTAPPFSITMDLRVERAIGGMRIDWGESYASDFSVATSGDGTTWQKAGEVHDGVGQFDYVMFPKPGARLVRLNIATSPDDRPVAIRDITFRGAKESLSPYAAYQFAAMKAPPGHYPEWLRDRQVYWTVVGLPASRWESLLDEYGNLEPRHGGWTLMPYVEVDGTLRSAMDATNVWQKLDSGWMPIPSVGWEFPDLRFTIEAVAAGSTTDPVTRVRYTISNLSSGECTARVLLTVRPLQINPPWGQGGFAPIRSMAVDGSVMQINGNDGFIAYAQPSDAGVASFNNGDVLRALARREVPAASEARDDQGNLSGVMVFDAQVAPGAEERVEVGVPQNPGSAIERPMEDFDGLVARQRELWNEVESRITLELPDADVLNTFRSQIAYILINRDGPAIQAGPRNYKRSWIRDGAMTASALLQVGLTEEARSFIDWYSAFVETNGWVRHIVNTDGSPSSLFLGEHEWDSQGQYVYAVMEYYRMTRDRAFLEQHFDTMMRALRFIEELRAQTLAPDYMAGEPARARFVGILPKSISHEGYIPAMHSYWDDFWALKGWKDGADAADLLGRTNESAWARGQYRALRASLSNAVRAAIAYHKIDFVPGCAEKGDFDPTSIAVAFYPAGEQDVLPQPELSNTFARFSADFRARRDPSWTGQFVPYEIRSVRALTDLGNPASAEELLRYLLGCRRPPAWNHWVELYVSEARKGTYIGDMPHTWIGSSYISVIRNLIVREEQDQLRLFHGTPREWFENGDGIRAENFPTEFGWINLCTRMTNNVLDVELGGDAHPPGGIEICLPRDDAPESVECEGCKVEQRGSSLFFREMPAHVRVMWRGSKPPTNARP